jgi:hypothetical protein
MLPATLLGASDPPAGGAATSDVIYATAGAMVVTVLLTIFALNRWGPRDH